MTGDDDLGEVLKVLKDTTIGDAKLKIELNAPVTENGSKIIHFQNDKFRLEMSEEEFLKIAGAVAYGWRNFEFLKGLKAK